MGVPIQNLAKGSLTNENLADLYKVSVLLFEKYSRLVDEFS